MIHRIFSDLRSFKELRFQPGLNILVAEKSAGATDKQTRNGAGKTSLIEIIHFLTGAKADPKSLLRNDALLESSFGIDFDLQGTRTVVMRSGKNPARLVVEGNFEAWPITPSRDRKTGEYTISNANWKRVLASLLFGLDEPDSEDDEDCDASRPSFRSMFSYFVRRERGGAFQSPLKNSSMQQIGDQQMTVSYLLGLDWSVPQEWQQVRAREKKLADLKRALADGTLGDVVESAATLRTRLALGQEDARRLRDALTSFRVLEQYHEFEELASTLTRELADLSDGNALDHRYATEIESAIESEVPPPPEDLDRLYREADVILPESALRRFDEVRLFHESVLKNRKSYLADERTAALARVEERGKRMAEIDQRRSEVLGVLQSHGALEQFSRLQGELGRTEAAVEAIRQKFVTAETMESTQVRLDAERARLLQRLQQDYREQEAVLNRAILAFEGTSRALYEKGGSLTFGGGPNGPQIEIYIHGEKSRGIGNMQVFCFDMMLMQIIADRGIGPGFVVHDSHLFDGVDERQAGKALAIGAKLAEKTAHQYIVTMNSDALPTELPSGFTLEPHVLPIRLTDATETGGLFGIRFA